MNTQMMELLDQAINASDDEQKAAAAAQAKQHTETIQRVKATYEKQIAELGSALQVKERELGDMEANVNTVLNQSEVQISRASKAQLRAESRAANEQKDRLAAEAEAATLTAHAANLESELGNKSLSSLVRKACPEDHAVQSIPSMDKIGERGEVSGRRLSDLGNATGSVIGAVLESTPTGRNDPVKVLQAIANRKDGAQTVAGAALREFAKNASLNSGSIGDTPICTNARAHTHIHTHTHTHTHPHPTPHSGVRELGKAWSDNMRVGNKEMARSNLSLLVTYKGVKSLP